MESTSNCDSESKCNDSINSAASASGKISLLKDDSSDTNPEPEQFKSHFDEEPVQFALEQRIKKRLDEITRLSDSYQSVLISLESLRNVILHKISLSDSSSKTELHKVKHQITEKSQSLSTVRNLTPQVITSFPKTEASPPSPRSDPSSNSSLPTENVSYTNNKTTANATRKPKLDSITMCFRKVKEELDNLSKDGDSNESQGYYISDDEFCETDRYLGNKGKMPMNPIFAYKKRSKPKPKLDTEPSDVPEPNIECHESLDATNDASRTLENREWNSSKSDQELINEKSYQNRLIKCEDVSGYSANPLEIQGDIINIERKAIHSCKNGKSSTNAKTTGNVTEQADIKDTKKLQEVPIKSTLIYKKIKIVLAQSGTKYLEEYTDDAIHSPSKKHKSE